MSKYLDPLTGDVLWRCPQCGESIRFRSELAVLQAERAGGCQGCRAKATFEGNPGLIGFFLDFWAGADAWPQSHSWMAAIPASGISIVGNAYPAARVQPGQAAPTAAPPTRAE